MNENKNLDNKKPDELSVVAGTRVKEREYWLSRLPRLMKKNEFPYDYTGGIGNQGNIEAIYFDCPLSLQAGLERLSAGSDIRLHMVLCAGVLALLYRYIAGRVDFEPTSEADDLPVGIGTSILKPDKEAEGGFINTFLLLYQDVTAGMTFKELLLKTRETMAGALEHRNYPVEVLIRQLGFSWEAGDEFPLCDIAVLVEGVHDAWLIRHLHINNLLIFSRSVEGWRGCWEFNNYNNNYNNKGVGNGSGNGKVSNHRRSTVERWVRHLLCLLESAVENPGKSVSSLDLLGTEDKKQLLEVFNTTGGPFANNHTLQGLFERQVESKPGTLALTYIGAGDEKREYTFKELNKKSGGLARELKIRGINRGDVIGLMAERSPGMIVGMLGILKAGAAYLPVNQKTPVSRVEYMMKDSRARLLLGASQEVMGVEIRGGLGIEMVNVDWMGDETRGEELIGEEIGNGDELHDQFQCRDLAYIIYTSGSTGNPKGVAVKHENVSPLLQWGLDYLGLGEGDRVLQNLSFIFDWSVWEIFITLGSGANLIQALPGVMLDPRQQVEFMKKHGVTVLHITPSQCVYLVNWVIKSGQRVDSLRYLFLGGEGLPIELGERCFAMVPGSCRVYNMYGPTEAAIIATVLEISSAWIPQYKNLGLSSIPIGGPVGNTGLYVLDRHQNLCPVGVEGELYIGGDGVVDGYLNDPEKTRNLFLEGFSQGVQQRREQQRREPGWREKHLTFYKTCDRVRWLADGTLEFLGRIDQQVKIRGYRIETGEIENSLLEYKDIGKVAVKANTYEDGEKYLCAYVVPGEGKKQEEVDIEALRGFLEKRLPGYMIPAFFMVLGAMPLTENGKVNMKALPVPAELEGVGREIGKGDGRRVDGKKGSSKGSSKRSSKRSIKNNMGPDDELDDELEKKLVGLWSEVLGLDKDKIGIDDDFFSLGGHSLKAASLILEIYKVLNVSLDVEDLLTNPTIRELGQRIAERERVEYTGLELVEDKDYYALSPAQKRLFILQQMNVEGIGYNLPVVLRIEGEREQAVDIKRWEWVFRCLIERHESLRTWFTMIGGEPVQVIADKSVEFKVGYSKLRKGEELAEVVRGFIRPFDLSQAPLLRVELVEEEAGGYLLMVDMHHIISDGWSMGIVVREFVELYGGGRSEAGGTRGVRYRDYAFYQENLFKWGVLKEQEKYWLEEFGKEVGGIPVLNIPLDRVRPREQDFVGENIYFKLSGGCVLDLEKLAREEEATVFMVVLAAYLILLSRLSSQEEDDIVVGTPVSGRTHGDLRDVVGMFVNTLAIRYKFDGERSVRGLVRGVKEKVLAGFRNQDYPFEMLVEKTSVRRDLGRNPLFDTMLAWESVDIRGVDLPGLTVKPYEYKGEIAKFDLTLRVRHDEEKQSLSCSFNYSRALFDRETVERWVQYLTRIMIGVGENREGVIDDIEWLGAAEKQKLLVEFNDTVQAFPEGKTLHGLFEEAAKENRDGVALWGHWLSGVNDDWLMLSYGELNRCADNLASFLIKKGIGVGDGSGKQWGEIVALLLEPSLEMVVAILGVLKTGAAYLPVDPGYPGERVAYMLADSQTGFLLTAREGGINHEINHEIYTSWKGEALYIEETGFKEVKDESGVNLEKIESARPAYIIYTSGTTGRPRGVLVEHSQVVNTLMARRECYGMGKRDKALQLFSYAFDGFITSCFTPLISGSVLVMPGREEIAVMGVLIKIIRGFGITHFIGVPSLYRLIIGALPGGAGCALQTVTLAGERLSEDILGLTGEKLEGVEIVNEYGVTEAAVMSTIYRHQERSRVILIGHPLANTRIVILDKNMGLQGIGIPGTIYIGGAGVARGYLNKPALTREKFTRDLLLYGEGERFYNTGDMGRWSRDGNIEFLGRVDHQVKIRGFRIEPGEIEAQLVKHEKIDRAVVVTRCDRKGELHLCAYITVRGVGQRVERKEIISFLSGLLPGYMVPSFIKELAAIPLTANGKIDLEALPDPFNEGPLYTFIGAQDETEKQLVDIWSNVLGVSPRRLSIDRDFFEMGGHSLRAALLAGKIEQVFKVRMPLKEIFKQATIRELAVWIRKAGKLSEYEIEPVEEREYYPLSFAQKRVYILHEMDRESIGYNLPMVMVLAGDVDKARLEKTLMELSRRHEILRTSFHLLENEPVQRVVSEVLIKVDMIKKEKVKEFTRAFDLTLAPLWRVGLVEEGKGQYIFMVDMHHIIADGFSLSMLMREFAAIYRGDKLSGVEIQYKDYAMWQIEKKARGELLKQGEYWCEVFSGEIPVLNLPVDFPRPGVQDYRGGVYRFRLNDEVFEQIEALAREKRATPFMIMLGLFTILLAKMSGEEDIIVGTPVAGRGQANLEKVMGMFVNTLALRYFPGGKKQAGDYLEEVKEQTLAGFENEDYPFEELVEGLGLARDTGRHPLFDVMFSYQNLEFPRIKIKGMTFSPYPFEHGISKFDMSWDVVPVDGELEIIINYSVALFKRETMERLGSYYQRLVTGVLKNKQRLLGDISLLDEKEREQVLVEFNQAFTEVKEEGLLHELFESQVDKTRDGIAVVGNSLGGLQEKGGGNVQLSYGYLNELGNRLAEELKAKGVQADHIVGIMMESGVEMVVGLLGILKAGGCYMPMAMDYPAERIHFMLADSHAKVLVTSLPIRSDMILPVEEIMAIGWNGLARAGETKEAGIKIKPETGNLAYIIYTSGSTGRPKGVMVEHRQVVNYVEAFNREFRLGSEDVVLQQASYTFDAFVEEVYPILSCGGRMVMARQGEIPGRDLLVEMISRHQVTLVSCSPLLLNELNQVELEDLKSIHTFISGGDRLMGSYIDRLVEVGRVYNTYGPTETTVCATYYRISGTVGSMIPVGKPITNWGVYILDGNLQPVPVGIPGELCVWGRGVTRGYLNHPELTAEKFVRTIKDIYRTGDLARWLADGNIEFLGRMDHQVKIRGYRIELGEIETQLLHDARVKETVVVYGETRDKGEGYTCAYVVLNECHKGDGAVVKEIRYCLSQRLPGYMIPTYMIPVEQIKRTHSGKVDRKSLPLPGAGGWFIEGGDVRPVTRVQQVLAEIWSDVLGLTHEQAGLDTDFFHVGGHSLKATLLAAQIHKRFNVKISLVELFKRTTIREQGKYIEESVQHISVKHGFEEIAVAEQREYYPLSAAQKRLFILQQMKTASTGYHLPAAWQLQGRLDEEGLKQAFKKLIGRHEILRTGFTLQGDEPVQWIEEDSPGFKLEQWTVKNREEVREIVENFVRPFDLSCPPLLRVGLIKRGEEDDKEDDKSDDKADDKADDKEYILVMDIHHIVVDGFSLGIIIRELLALYLGETLPAVERQYKDVACWQNRDEYRQALAEGEKYWLKEFAGEIPVLEIPIDYPRPLVQNFAGGYYSFLIGKEEVEGLKRLSKKEGTSLFMILLTLSNILWGKLSGSRDIVVGTPSAGRGYSGLENMVGMFVNTLALRNYPDGEKDFPGFLKEVKERTLQAFENEAVPFEDLVEHLQVRRDIGRNPLFDVMLALQNLEDIKIDLKISLRDLTLKPYEYQVNTAKFDMSWSCKETASGLFVGISYAAALFKLETVQRFARYFQAVVTFILQYPEAAIKDIDMLSPGEKERLLIYFNDTTRDKGRDKTILGLFEEEVERAGDRIALMSPVLGRKKDERYYRGEERCLLQLSYRELNRRVRGVARGLKARGAGVGDIIGIVAERSVEMMVGLLGILKAGGAYMPISPGYPQERVDFMLADSGAKIVITAIGEEYTPGKRNVATTCKSTVKSIEKPDIQSTSVWEITQLIETNPGEYGDRYEQEVSEGLPAGVGEQVLASDVVYVIYTSGTTGRPKGVLVEHGNAVNTVTWWARSYGVSSGSHVLQMSDYTFDPSVNQIFGALGHGAVLYLIEGEILYNSEGLRDYIQCHEIEVVNFVPLLLNELLGQGGKLNSIRVVLSGGERLDEGIKKSILEKGYELYNQYGPTETTIDALVEKCSGEKVTLGRPIDNTYCLVLDDYGRVVPVGVAGELYIGGAGVARGYLNRPELTNERFILFDKSFGERVPGATYYRTGDRVRWLENGKMEFLGRFDQQVKIRGYRVELGEIETVLLKLEQIKEAVVIFSISTEQKDKTGAGLLCAYLVAAKGEEEIREDKLKEYLASWLPGYMVPSSIFYLNSIPVTASGKIDRMALPVPGIKEGGYVAPGDELEAKLLEIFSAVVEGEKGGKDVRDKERRVGIDDNFFEMGGHSLKAVMLISRLKKLMGISMTLADLFIYPTVRKLAQVVRKRGLVGGYEAVGLVEVEKKEYYVLSSAQKRLYVLYRLGSDGNDGAGLAYNLPKMMLLEGGVDKKELAECFRRLIERHESLRTSFRLVNEEPVQVIHDQVDFSIEYDRGEGEFVRPFDLSRAPLVRVGLVDKFGIGEGQQLLMVDMHHIVTDGTSLQIMMREFVALYSGKRLRDLKLQYRDYAEWQQGEEEQGVLAKQERYWLDKFAGEVAVLNMPYDFPRPVEQDFSGAGFVFGLDGEETGLLKEMASGEGVTLFMVLLGVFNVLLGKLSGLSDIVVGTPVAARRIQELEYIVGMFVNTLALRHFPRAGLTFSDFLGEVKENTLQAFDNQEYPFENLVERVVVRRDTGRNPLFDVMFGYHHFEGVVPGVLAGMVPGGESIEPVGWGEEVGPLKLKPYGFEWGLSQFDFSFHVIESQGELRFLVEYCTGLFRRETMERLAGYFKQVISEVLSDGRILLEKIEIMSEIEKQQLLEMCWGVDEPVERTLTIHGWFEEQVQRTPGHVALVEETRPEFLSFLPGGQGGGFLEKSRPGCRWQTYRQLNQWASCMAVELWRRGFRSGGIIGLMMERSLEMIVGILGILKTGSAYLPIDPGLPGERVKYILRDSGVSLVLTDGVTMGKVGKEGLGVGVEMMDVGVWECTPGNGEELEYAGVGDSGLPVYVIYTSGSTGRPKGVVLEHGNLVNLLAYQYRHMGIDFSRVLQFATLSFDVSFQEIFSALLSGGELVLISVEVRANVLELFSIVRGRGIVTLFLPVSFLKMVFREEEYIEAFPGCVRHIVTAGEQLVVSERMRSYLKDHGVFLHNHYGPSETHVVTALALGPGDEIKELPSIGEPVANTGIFIFDPSFRMVPQGVAGELFIGGVQVGRGYLNNPGLTAERFWSGDRINDRIKGLLGVKEGEGVWGKGELSGGSLYRSGDLARWLGDGNIEFLGRVDHQVKIRGFRIEPGEIENRLMSHEGIKEAVVVVYEAGAGDKYLCAYVVPMAGKESVDRGEWGRWLGRDLPDYMIPSHFVVMEKIPLTPSGKVDRRVLPVPGFQVETSRVAPRDEVEIKLAGLWRGVLGGDSLAGSVGIDDHFFEKGGHSLKATVLISKIHKAFDIRVPLLDIFKWPTIRQLAEVIKKKRREVFQGVEPVEEREYYGLSSAQLRLYILQRLEPGSTAYHMPLVLKLSGDVDRERLERVFWCLIERHESLRTSFIMVGQKPVQRVQGRGDMEWASELLSGETGSVEERIKKLVRPFDLSRAPLLRVSIFEWGAGSYILFVDMHHTIADGNSLSILIREFGVLYRGGELPGLRVQYKDFAQWQNGEKQGEGEQKRKEFWLKEFTGAIPVLELPGDFVRPVVKDYQGKRYRFGLGKEETGWVKRWALAEEATLYMVLLTIYYIWLSRLSGSEDVVVGSPVAGRGHDDLEPVMGMFVNTLALRAYPARGKRVWQLVKEVKETSLGGFENQDYAFEDLLEQLGDKVMRDPGRHPLFDVMFALQNLEMGRDEGSGLKVEGYAFESGSAKFDMTLLGMETGDEVSFTLEYRTSLFKEETVARMSRYYTRLLLAAVEGRESELGKLEMIPGAERKKLVEEFNDTTVKFPGEQTINDLFVEQAERGRDGVAVVQGRKWLTNGALNESAQRLAMALQEKGVGRETIVAVMVERSVEMLIMVLGILKAGGAYLPIDYTLPFNRVRYFLVDSGARLLLTTVSFQGMVAGWDFIPVVFYEEEMKGKVGVKAPVRVNKASDLAYVIYTSGTTGRPKGTLVEHGSVVNLIYWHREYYGISGEDRATQVAPFSFDGCVWEMFPNVVSGVPLHIIPDEIKLDMRALKGYINQNRISICFMTTQLGRQFLLDDMEVKGLRSLLVGGEKLQEVVWRGYGVYNNYGPTETTVVASAYRLEEKEENYPIGRPIANSQVFVIDPVSEKLQPLGVPGECCIGGIGLCRGYLNRPGLTAEKFITWQERVTNEKGIEERTVGPLRLYKTGDLVKWRTDGNLEYVGRIDQQVKIRGFRIELGEIESLLVKHPQIKEAAVIEQVAGGGRDTMICAYVVGKEKMFGQDEMNELRAYLGKELPPFMIPSSIQWLERLPLTANGKLDRKALPRPEAMGTSLTARFVAPGTEKEKYVAEAWKEVLKIDTVGLEDNFFELGGNSLSIIELTTKLKEKLGIEIATVTLFRFPKISAFLEFIENERIEVKQQTVPGQVAKRTETVSKGKDMMRRAMEKRRK